MSRVLVLAALPLSSAVRLGLTESNEFEVEAVPPSAGGGSASRKILDDNGAPHPDASAHAKKFSGKYTHRIIQGGVGHNLPQEAPKAFAQAVVDVDGY